MSITTGIISVSISSLFSPTSASHLSKVVLPKETVTFLVEMAKLLESSKKINLDVVKCTYIGRPK